MEFGQSFLSCLLQLFGSKPVLLGEGGCLINSWRGSSATCSIQLYVELTEIVRDKAESERRALGACLQRCSSWHFPGIDGISCGVRYGVWG